MNNLYAMALTFIKGIGPILAKTLIVHYGQAENVFKEKSKVLATIPRVGQYISDEKLKNEALKRAETEIEFAAKHNIKIHYYLDKTYPYRLKECEDSPVILYQFGDFNLNQGNFLSIVGTRNITPYGKNLTNSLVSELSTYQSNITVVSGLAYGVDSIAHKAALNEKIPTIAVMAHGLDTVYPSQHRKLAEQIIIKNGAIISEYPSHTKPDAPNFVQRNRIIAGLSDAVVIVESAEKGGALLTASAANSYNRDVFAFAGRVDDVFSQGCNNLIKTNQAQMITCADDIFKIMGWKKNAEKQQSLFIELTEEERKIVEILRHNQMDANDLSRKAGIPIQKLVSMLVLMEFNGVIKALPGNVYEV